MLSTHAKVKPALLMISHCLPDARGPRERARAWQLMRLVAQSHQVDLACLLDSQINLDQWRSIQKHVHDMAIEIGPRARRWLIGGLGRIDPSAAQCPALTQALGPIVEQWAARKRFDAVLLTHPSLWPLASAVGSALSVCDLESAPMLLAGARPESHAAACTRRQRRLAHRYADLLNELASGCNVLTVGHAEDKRWLAQRPCLTLALPQALDLNYFRAAIDGEGSPGVDDAQSPSLVLHADWQTPQGRELHEWFTHRVWPQVRDAVPSAHLGRSESSANLDALRRASVVVSPASDPADAHWPILQAMAMRRPVIASGAAVKDLGVRHDEHLLLSQRPEDWAELCVASLRSAQVRLRLACAGRSFVERHCPIEQTGDALLKRLAGPDCAQPLAQAA